MRGSGSVTDHPSTNNRMGRPANSPVVNPLSGPAELDPDSDCDMVHPDQQNRTRQKKFIKNFKGLPIEETVHKRYSCALVGDILLQGHLYVTENYLGFHSNVFGYVTRIQIPLLSVTSITKEKTVKFIPNAVAVSTLEDTHTFTSLISRDATFKAMTKSWRKAVARSNITSNSGCEELGANGVDDDEDDDEVDGDDQNEYESTDSMTSSNKVANFALPAKKDIESKGRFLVKRSSSNGGAVFYQARTSFANSRQQSKEMSPPTSSTLPHSLLHQFLVAPFDTITHLGGAFLSLPSSTLLLTFFCSLLLLLLISSLHLASRLETLRQRIDRNPGENPEHHSLEHLAGWQQQQHDHSSKLIQQYLDRNLEQIIKVKRNLERLTLFLDAQTKSDVDVEE